MSVADYTSKVKEICDSLASVNVNVEEDEMVQVSWWASVKVGSVLNNGLHKGEYAFVLYASCCSRRKITMVHRRVHTPTTRCCTQRKIGPVVVVNEADWRVMEAAEKS